MRDVSVVFRVSPPALSLSKGGEIAVPLPWPVGSRAAGTASPDFSPGVVAKRRRGVWIRGLRPRTPQAYPGRYVEDGRGSVTK
jgi:hypothetical protein